MRISSVSVTGLVSGVSDVTGISSSIFVSLGAVGSSTTGIVCVFAPLELVPDISVGVLKKILPLGVAALTLQDDRIDFEDQRVFPLRT